MELFYVFRNIFRFRKPMEYPVENFCSAVFDDIQEHNVTAEVIELIHFKEKVRFRRPLFVNPHLMAPRRPPLQNKLQHEFLVAEIKHKGDTYFVRVERGTQQVSRRRPLIHTSSSIAVVSDSVKVAKDLAMLTTGMARGDSDRIATFSLKTSPYPFREFCLLLALFSPFSPDYKLMGEQCYWFVDVIIRAVQKRSASAIIQREPKFHRAGKYGSVTVPKSSVVCANLVQTFEVLAAFTSLDNHAPTNDDWWLAKTDTIESLALLISSEPNAAKEEHLSSVTIEVQRRAAGALALITRGSQSNLDAFCDVNGINKLLQLLDIEYSTIHPLVITILANIAASPTVFDTSSN
jgi:putative lipoic acid-binding regulatory protein